MTNIYKYDIVVVKFPFASSLKYKARPAIVVSSNIYNKNTRGTLIILAISSSIENRLDFEVFVKEWKEAGLLKPSIFKSAVATIQRDSIITKLGKLQDNDIKNLNNMLDMIC
ncbi:MAG: type II toxin-antitoxin system PemK/MazF family toxin [Sulfurospirillaceae bacterium]